jgi:polysaccharide biosynthesis transport protein
MNQFNQAMKIQEPVLQDSVSGDEIDFRHYWNIVWREKLGIIGLAMVVSVMTIVVAYNITPIYRATASLLIESKEANVVSIEEVYGIDSSQREYFATQFEILHSRELAATVIRELGIAKHPEYAPEQKKPFLDWRKWIPILPDPKLPNEDARWQGVVDAFQARIQISPIRKTQLVKISFESTYPDLTHKVVNALGEAYINGYLESRIALTQKASTWLTDRLGGMRQDLEKAEQALQNFREKENLVDVSGVQTLTAREIDEITGQLVTIRNKTSVAKSQYEAVGEAGDGYQDVWETLPGVLNDSLAQDLKNQEALASSDMSELSKRYGPKHPKLIAANSNFQNAVIAYQARVRKVVSGFEETYRQSLADQQSLESALVTGKQTIRDINRKSYELSQLERDVQTSQNLYNMFFTRFKETDAAAFEAANARFVDRAVKPIKPVKPRKSLIVGLAGVLSLLAGVMLAFLRDMLDNTIKVSSEVESKLHQPVIGVLPLIRTRAKDVEVSKAVLDVGQQGFAEAVRTTRTGIVLSGLDKPCKKVVFTSSVPREGKTTLSMNIAFAFGQMEKVVLVDADMRRPSVAENCGFEHRTPGLSNIIAQTHQLKECTYAYNEIDVIPAGIVPPNPLELLSSTRFQSLLKVLNEEYDRIIIDAAPTQAVSDSLMLAQMADGVVYVVRADSTPIEVAQAGISRLLRVNAHILGVALNQFDATSASRYGYDSDYYGYGSSKGYA